MVTLAREVCGSMPVLHFAGYIFDLAKSGPEGVALKLSPNQQAMMLGAVQVAGSIIASTFVERAGRKVGEDLSRVLKVESSQQSSSELVISAEQFMGKEREECSRVDIVASKSSLNPTI